MLTALQKNTGELKLAFQMGMLRNIQDIAHCDSMSYV